MSSLVGWPTFIIAGAGRSGKMALCRHLNSHPEIFITQPPEPNFFCFFNEDINFTSKDELFYKNIILNIKDYNNLFASGSEIKEKGEASGSYLKYADKTISIISSLIPNYEEIKIIITLRNPVDRAFSSYTQYVMHGFEKLSFEDAISKEIMKERVLDRWSPNYDYLAGGLYSESVKKYLSVFTKVKIIISEEMRSETYNTVKDCFNFLELDASIEPTIETNINISGATRNSYLHHVLYNENNSLRKLSRYWLKFILSTRKRNNLKEYLREINLNSVNVNLETRRNLINFYKEDILELESTIKKDLSSWLTI